MEFLIAILVKMLSFDKKIQNSLKKQPEQMENNESGGDLDA